LHLLIPTSWNRSHCFSQGRKFADCGCRRKNRIIQAAIVLPSEIHLSGARGMLHAYEISFVLFGGDFARRRARLWAI
jgi:hypothetical protein